MGFVGLMLVLVQKAQSIFPALVLGQKDNHDFITKKTYKVFQRLDLEESQ